MPPCLFFTPTPTPTYTNMLRFVGTTQAALCLKHLPGHALSQVTRSYCSCTDHFCQSCRPNPWQPGLQCPCCFAWTAAQAQLLEDKGAGRQQGGEKRGGRERGCWAFVPLLDQPWKGGKEGGGRNKHGLDCVQLRDPCTCIGVTWHWLCP